MGDFKILMSVTMATLLLLLQGCTLVISRPPGSTGGAEKDGFSKDYNALQNILGKHLAGTSTEKSKVIDLLLQLLEEIDLPTLCEVIINDTKASNQAPLRVPIKYTKIDVDLLNSMDPQMAMENPGNEATLQPPSKMDMGADISTSAESHEQMAIKNNGEESSDHHDGTKDNNHTPVIYKYHTDELNNGDRISSQDRQYAKEDSFNNVNYPEELSSSTLSSGDSKENPGNDISSQDLLTDGQVLYSSLLKPNTAPDADDGNTMKVIGDLKQMYLTSHNNHGAEDNDALSGYTNDINNKNILVKQIDVERPRAQLFSHSLVLGDWTNKNRFDRNFLTTYTDNEAELRAIYGPHQNNVVASDAWSDNVKSEYKTRFSPTKQQQQKYARGYLDSHDNVGQMISPEISTLPSTLATYDPTDVSRSITPLENQRQVDYLEELRSTLMVKEPNKNIPTLVKDADTSHKDGMASMAMFSKMKTNFPNAEFENAVFDSDSNEAATDKQHIKMLVDYSNVKEFRDNNNVINHIDNNGFPQEMANWIDASHFIPESRPAGKSDELPYGEQGVTDAITSETSPQSHLTTPSTSFIATEPQVQLLLSETDNQTANPSSTQSSQNPSEMATPATALFSTTIDTEILTGNFDVTQTTASTVQEQAINETAEQSSSFGLPQHTSASNLPRWAQNLYTNSSSTGRTHDPDAVPEETKLGSLDDNVVLNNEQVKDEPSTAFLDSQTAQSTVTYSVNALTNESTSMDYPPTAQSTVTYSVNALTNESTSMDYPQTAQSTVTYSVNALTNESTSMDYPQTAQSTVTYSVNALTNESTSMDYPQTAQSTVTYSVNALTNESTSMDYPQTAQSTVTYSVNALTNESTSMDYPQTTQSTVTYESTSMDYPQTAQSTVTYSVNALTNESTSMDYPQTAQSTVTYESTSMDYPQTAQSTVTYSVSALINESTSMDYPQMEAHMKVAKPGVISASDVETINVTQGRMTADDNATHAWVANNHVRPVGVGNNEVTQAGVINSYGTQAGVTNSDFTQTGVSNNEVTQAGITTSDATQLEFTYNNATQAGVTDNNVTQAEVTNSDVTQAGVTNSDATQAGVTNSDVTQAGVTNSDVTQAGVTNSDVTQAGVTNSDVTQAGVTNSDVTQAGVINSDITQAEFTNNNVTQAGITISDVTQAVITNSDVTQTKVSDNDVTQAGVTYNDVTQAGVTYNDVTQAGVTYNDVTQARVRNNNVTQTLISNNEVTQVGVTNSDVTKATVTNNNVTQTEVSNNEVTQVGVTNSDVTQVGVTNSDVAQATVTNNNVTQTEVSNNEVTQVGVTNSDVTQATVTNNNVTQTEFSNKEVTQAGVTNSDVTQVGVTNSDVAQATVTNNNVTQTEVSNNEVTQVEVTNSDVTQATVTNNNVTQTEVSNNEVTQAGVTNSDVTQIGVTNSDVTQAGVTNSDVTQATVTNNNVTQTEVSNNEVTQAGVTNSDVTQIGVTNSDVTQAGVTNSDVTQATVTNNNVTQTKVNNNEVTQAGVTYSDVTQAGVTNNDVTQTEVRNNEATQAEATSSDVINTYITDNIPDAGVTNSDVSHDDLTNNHTTPMNFTNIATQQSSVFDATTTDQIQHTSPVTTTTAQESYLPFSQTRNPSVLISMTTTNDVVVEAVSKSNVTTSNTDENSLPITNSSEVVEEESALQEKQSENKTASIVTVKDTTRNISNNVEADSGDVVMNTSSQTNIWLSADRNVLGEDVSQNTSYVSAYTTESGILGDVNNVSAATGHNVEEDVTVNTTIESNISATRSTGADISASPEVTSLFTSTHAPVMISTVSNTLEPEVQSYPPVVDTDASLSMMNLSNDVLTSQNMMSVSENLTFVQSLNEILGSANTTEEAINTTTTVSSTAFNSELPASTQMDPTGLDVNTTVTATTDNITVDTTENNFNAAPKFVLEKTADFDNFIQPTIIDYGSNRMDGSTLEISIKQQSSETSSEEPTSSTSSVIVQNNTVTGVQRTDNEVKETYNLTDTEATYNLADTEATYNLTDTEATYNLTDTEATYNLTDTEATYNLADTEATYNLTDTEENTTSFTSQATISFLATSLNDSEAKTVNVDVIEPVTLRTSANTGTLSQVLRGNITTDNLKMISSKIAETKANLSRINMDLLKPLQIRIPYEDRTSETPPNTETVSMSEDKNISSAKNETSEQQATFTPESTNTGSPVNDISTELTYVVTTANPIEYTTTTSTTSTPTVTDAASSTEIITPAFKSSISSVKTMSSSITIPSDSIHETSAPSSAGSSYKPDDLKDFTQNILDGYSGSFEYSNIPKSDYVSGEDKTQFSSTSVPQSGNWAKVYDFPYLPINGKYPNKPSNRPYMSQFSDHAGQTQPRTKPVLDSWKVYNIAVGKAKTNVNTQDIIDQSGAPEIHLFSNYRYTPAPVDNLRNYLWQARPWPKNAVENLGQGATYNRMVASKPELYQNQNMDMSKSVNYQTKALNKIDSRRDQVKKIGNANIWGNRFSQGYYGRVFDDQSNELNTDDSTTWPTFHSRDMVNFDTLGGDNLKYFKGYNQVQSSKNKRNNFNGNLRMQSSHSFDLNQRYRDLMKTFPQYHNAELDQETPSNVQQSRAGTQPDYDAAWNEDSSAYEAQSETSTVPETEVTGFRTTDTSTHYNGVPAPEDYTCPGLFGYHKDPKNCQAFFICSWGMAHRVVCPPGTLYNSKEAVCDWAVNIRCTVTPDNSKTLTSRN